MPHIEISVIQGRQLAIRDSNGSSDPYVVVSTSLSNNHFRTKVIKRDLNPWWGETVTFSLKDPQRERLRFEVYDKDLIGKDSLGSLELAVNHLEMGHELVNWYQLSNIEQGEIQIGLKAIDFGVAAPIVSGFMPPFPVAPGASPMYSAAPPPGYYPPPSAFIPPPGVAYPPPPGAFAPLAAAPPPAVAPAVSSSPHHSSMTPETALDKESLLSEASKSGFLIGYHELRFERRIGSGGFGEIWKGEWAGTTVAIKKILNVNMTDNDIQALSHEISLTSKLRHPNIVPFLGACFEPEFCLVLDFCDHGSLFHVLADKSIPIDWARKLSFCLDAAKGFLYLHTRTPPIVHRDVKSLNILITSEWKALVSDFGLTKVKEAAKLDTRCGSPAWTAPEILRGEGCTEKADVFSFGIVLWEVLARSPPYPGIDAMALIGQVAYQKPPLRPPIPEGCPDPRFVELMVQCWDDNPNLRPDFQQIVDRLKAMSPQTPPH